MVNKFLMAHAGIPCIILHHHEKDDDHRETIISVAEKHPNVQAAFDKAIDAMNQMARGAVGNIVRHCKRRESDDG